MKRDLDKEHEARVRTELEKLAVSSGVCADKPDQKVMNALQEAYLRGRRRGKEDALRELESNRNHNIRGGRHP